MEATEQVEMRSAQREGGLAARWPAQVTQVVAFVITAVIVLGVVALLDMLVFKSVAS